VRKCGIQEVGLNSKALKKLKKEWPRVLKKGGHFILATNGFPADETQVPLLQVDREKPLDRAYLTKIDKSLDLAKKIIIGRVSVEEGKLAFNISPESRCKSPTLLRKSVRRLAEEPDYQKLKFSKAIRARFRMDSADLDGEDGLDDAETAEQRGGRASKKSKSFGSSWTQILASLKKWHKTFGRHVTPDQVPRARVGLDKTEVALDKWLAKHADDAAKQGRKDEIERIKAGVTAARARLNDLEQRMAADDEADDVLQQLADGEPVEPALVQRATAALRDRIGRTQDTDELVALTESLDQLQGVCDQQAVRLRTQLGDLRRAEQDRPEDQRDPRERQRLAEAALDAQSALQDALLGKMEVELRLAGPAQPYVSQLSPELLEQVEQQSHQLLADAIDPAVRDQQVNSVVDRISMTRERLDRGQCVGASKRLRDAHRDAAVQTTRRELEFAAQQTDARTFNGAILRGNSTSSKLRAGLARYEGEVLGEAVMAPVFDRVEEEPDLALNSFDEDKEPGATLAYGQIEQQTRLVRAQIQQAAERLAPLLSARLVGVPVESHEITAFLLPAGSLSAVDAIERPDLDALAQRWVEADPKREDQHRAAVVDAACGFIAQSVVSDPDPAATRAVVEEAVAGIQGPVLDVDAVIERVPDLDHWTSVLFRGDVQEKMVEVGLDIDLQQAEPIFEQVDQNLSAVTEARDRLPEQLEQLQEASQITVQTMRETLVSVMERLLADPMAVPRPIRELVLEAANICEDIDSADQQTVRRIGTDVVMLRWLVPRLAVPRPDPETGYLIVPRTQVQVSTLLQLIANGIVSNKPEVLPYADLLRDYIPRWYAFLDTIVDQTRAESGVDPYDSRRPEELALVGDATAHWKLCTRYLSKEAEKFVRYDLDGVALLHRSGLPRFFKPLRQVHQERHAQPDAFEIGWRGRTHLLNEVLEQAYEMFQEEARRIGEGHGSPIFTPLEDEDHYDAEEHWDLEVRSRFNTLLSRLLSEGPFQTLCSSGDPITGLLGDLRGQHEALFDPNKHGVLPMKRSKMDEPLAALFDTAEERLRAAMRQGLEGDPTWFVVG